MGKAVDIVTKKMERKIAGKEEGYNDGGEEDEGIEG